MVVVEGRDFVSGRAHGSGKILAQSSRMLTEVQPRRSAVSAIGSLVYPLSILIEAPIIMLLAASTALVTDLATHRRLLRFTHAASALRSLPSMEGVVRLASDRDERVVVLRERGDRLDLGTRSVAELVR